MMTMNAIPPVSSGQEQSLDGSYRFYCKLFGDMVSKGLCLLRRRELNGKDQFNCRDCSKDILMDRSQRQRIVHFTRPSK